MTKPSKRILIVDDNKQIHEDFKSIILPHESDLDEENELLGEELFGDEDTFSNTASGALAGYTIDDAYQGEDAINMVEQAYKEGAPYCLVFMDVRMPPGIDGIETIKRIWEKEIPVEIVICTAYSDYSWDDIIKQVGTSDHLLFMRKPFDIVAVKQTTLAMTTKWFLAVENRDYLHNLESIVEDRTRELNETNAQLMLQIEERKRAEEQTLAFEKQLHQSQKMEAIGRLAGGIAHDFNNMLGAISGYSDMLIIKYAKDNPQIEKLANGIFNASQRAAELTGKLLAFARKGKFKVETINLHEVIRDAVGILEHTIDKAIVIKQQLNAEPPTVNGDRSQLLNAILNVALNARDAMEDGGELIFNTEIYVLDEMYKKEHPYVKELGAYVQICVSDNGTGMSKEVQEHIFEPFYTTKFPGKGTGLGMSSVYGTVKNHGGTIEVYSEEGWGSTIKLYIPSIDREVEPQKIKQSVIHRGTGNILVVDDEEFIRNMAGEILADLGYTIHGCKDGEDAIAYYKEHADQVDLVLLDVVMPKVNGYQCFKELKKMNPDVVVIISSGYSKNDEVNKMLSQGAIAFIQKPFDIKRLSKVVYDGMQGKNGKE